MLPFFILGSSVGVALLALVGAVFFLFLREEQIQDLVRFFVSFAVGAILANVFLHLLPEVAAQGPLRMTGFPLVLGGVLLSFMLEQIIRWHHCHRLPSGDLEHCHRHIGVLNLIGDSLHNIIDGTLIAGAFLVSVPLGITTTLTIALHEVPQEIGDFAVLLYAGYSKGRALVLNLLVASTILLGASAVLFTAKTIPLIGTYLLPIAAGNFLYIAGADLIPELHKEVKTKAVVLQLLIMLGGIALIAWLSAVGGG